MSTHLESARQYIERFKSSRVGQAPPLEDTISLVEADPKLVRAKFHRCYYLVRALFKLTPAEIGIVGAVNRQLATPRCADSFLQVFANQEDQFLTHMRDMCDLDHQPNHTGLTQLTFMMHNAWAIRQSDPAWTPRDGDPAADNVIWGFVKGADNPRTDLDFTMWHGIERILTGYYPTIAMVHHKDWLLCALNDVVALRGLNGHHPAAAMLPLWSTPRPAGLGWISPSRLSAYREHLAQP